MNEKTDRRLDLLIHEAGIDSRIIESDPCGGGCIAEVHRLRVEDGRSFIAKISPVSRRGSNHLETRAHEEAAGLAAIAVTGTVPVPEVLGIGVSDGEVILMLEDLGESQRPSTSDWIDFGSRLADLHASFDVRVFGSWNRNRCEFFSSVWETSADLRPRKRSFDPSSFDEVSNLDSMWTVRAPEDGTRETGPIREAGPKGFGGGMPSTRSHGRSTIGISIITM